MQGIGKWEKMLACGKETAELKPQRRVVPGRAGGSSRRAQSLPPHRLPQVALLMKGWVKGVKGGGWRVGKGQVEGGWEGEHLGAESITELQVELHIARQPRNPLP